MPTTWPTDAEAAELFRRLLAGDATATGAFAAAFLDPLADHLRRTFPTTDDHLSAEAAGDALIAVIHRPTAFDPARGALMPFLRLVARRRLLNRRRRDNRHHTGRVDWESVELGVADGNTDSEDIDDPELSFDRPEFAAVVAGFTADERAVFELMRDGERDNEPFALALGVAELPDTERRRTVKQVKDRIKARFKRAGGGCE